MCCQVDCDLANVQRSPHLQPSSPTTSQNGETCLGLDTFRRFRSKIYESSKALLLDEF